MPAQRLPPATEEGKKAALELMNASVKGGAIKVVKDPSTGSQRLVVADETKLKKAARYRPGSSLRPSGMRRCAYHNSPGAVALLLRLGEEAGDDRAVAFGYLFSGDLLNQQGGYQQARQAYERAASLFERLKLTAWWAVSLNNLALACQNRGDLPRARQFSEQALALFKQLYGNRNPLVATSLNNLAQVCRAQGDLSQAYKLQKQALAVFKHLYGDHHATVAKCLHNLATVCRDRGDLPRARHLAKQALALFKQLHGNDHYSVAISMNGLAGVCLAQGELLRARKLHEQALALFKQLLGNRHPDVAHTLSGLAEVCQAQRDLLQARKFQEQALALYKQLYGDCHPAVAALYSLTLLCRAQRDLPRAGKLAEQALALTKQLHGGRHPDVANSLHCLAAVCHARGDLSQATRYQTEAALSCRLPGGRDRVADLRPEDLNVTAATVLQLRELGWLLASADNSPDVRRLRQASTPTPWPSLSSTASAPTACPRKVSSTKMHATPSSFLPALLWPLPSLARPARSRICIQLSPLLSRGRGRVFLETLARARAHQIGGTPEKLRAEDFDLRSYLRGLDAAISKENAKALDKRNANLVMQLYEQRTKTQQELDTFAARLRKDYPQYAALQYPETLHSGGGPRLPGR